MYHKNRTLCYFIISLLSLTKSNYMKISEGMQEVLLVPKMEYMFVIHIQSFLRNNISKE